VHVLIARLPEYHLTGIWPCPPVQVSTGFWLQWARALQHSVTRLHSAGLASGRSAPQPVTSIPLCLATQASRRLWLDFQSALWHRLAAIDADAVAAVLQPDQRVKH